MSRRSGNKDDGELYHIAYLEDAKVHEFLMAAEEIGFLSWKDQYVPDPHITGGFQVWIRIVFSDSTEKKVYGFNAYPEKWDEMWDALNELIS